MKVEGHFTITNFNKNRKYALANKIENNEKPDFYGLYFILANSFLSRESVLDFLYLSRDFLIKKNYMLEKYRDYFFSPKVYCHSGVNSMIILVKNVIFGASSHQDRDASDILLNIYKTHYKTEYNQLKKFHKLTDDDIMSIFNVTTESITPISDIVRVICMAQLMNKQIDESCYPFIENCNSVADEIIEDDFAEFVSEEYKDNDELIKNKFNEMLSMFPFCNENGSIETNALQKYIASYKQVGDFIKYTFLNFKIGTNELDFISDNPFLKGMSDEDYISEAMNITNILYKCFPLNYKGETSRGDKIKAIIKNDEYFNLLVGLYRTVEYFSCIIKDMLNVFDLTIGLTGETAGVSEKYLAKENTAPELGQVNAPVKTQNTVQEEKKDSDDNYIIMDLKSKLKIYKSEILSLREEITELKKHIFIQETSLSEAKSEKNELIHLRNYLHSLTKKDESESYNNLDEMKAFISKKSVCIIGGHQNWINKMKKEFPNWVYIVPKIGPSFNPMPLLKSDYIYFFTDILKHSTYYSCIATCRENDLHYDYIHNVNLEKMIVDIYKNFQKKEGE